MPIGPDVPWIVDHIQDTPSHWVVVLSVGIHVNNERLHSHLPRTSIWPYLNPQKKLDIFESC